MKSSCPINRVDMSVECSQENFFSHRIRPFAPPQFVFHLTPKTLSDGLSFNLGLFLSGSSLFYVSSSPYPRSASQLTNVLKGACLYSRSSSETSFNVNELVNNWWEVMIYSVTWTWLRRGRTLYLPLPET
jgi:hypothetical protein